MEIAHDNIPAHVAVIMDGNGRWAGARGAERLEGHRHGVDAVRDMVMQARRQGVSYLTIYAFSTENWGRPTDEVDGLMELIANTIVSELPELSKQGIALRAIGNLAQLPANLRRSVEIAHNTTPADTQLTLTIALNYGGREEITAAVREIVASGEKSENITADLISQHLYTSSMPDPDLLIRTSGEIRLSNFMLWQLSYTELYFTETLWPDFNGSRFDEALSEYANRKRRYGKL